MPATPQTWMKFTKSTQEEFNIYQQTTNKFSGMHPIEIPYSTQLNEYERGLIKALHTGELAADYALTTKTPFAQSLDIVESNFPRMYREYQRMQTYFLKRAPKNLSHEQQKKLDKRTRTDDPLFTLARVHNTN